VNDGNPGQTQAAFPGRGAARSVAPQIRGPEIFNALSNGSRFSSAPIRAALRPGHEVDVTARILHPPGWAPPIGYANGVAAAAGEIVFIAGQVGWNAEQRFTSEDLAVAIRAGARERARGAQRSRRRAGRHLPDDRLLHRQARLPCRAS
jgi:hypothetical protein